MHVISDNISKKFMLHSISYCAFLEFYYVWYLFSKKHIFYEKMNYITNNCEFTNEKKYRFGHYTVFLGSEHLMSKYLYPVTFLISIYFISNIQFQIYIFKYSISTI